METEKEKRWIFTKSELMNTPSRKCGIDSDKELTYRQQAATMIQDMGQRLQVTQLCINTAIVYMHRFYMYHSFTRFHRNVMAPACIFLAAKVEEQPRKLEHVLKERHRFLYRDGAPFDTKSEAYLEQAQELVVNENILLQTLGFDITVDHPHTHVVKTCQLVGASKDFAQTSYFLATNSLHLTTMCLQYRPTVVACVCIHLASKWADYEINTSKEGKEWYWYIDKAITLELLEELTRDFLNTLEKCPDRLKRSLMQKQRVLMDKEQDVEQPAKKRSRLEPSATVTSSSSSTAETKSKPPYLLSGSANVRLMGPSDSKAGLPQPQSEGRIRDASVMQQSHLPPCATLPIVQVKTEPGSTVVSTMPVDKPVIAMKEQASMPLVADIKQEPGTQTSRAPEKLSLHDYRQRQPVVQPPREVPSVPSSVKEEKPLLPSKDRRPSPQQLKEVKHEGVVMPDHLQLKEAKVVVHDLQHSHGHDKLMFTSAQNAVDAGRKRHHGDSGSESEKRRHHHHHHHSRGSHEPHLKRQTEGGESRRHSSKSDDRESGKHSGHDSERNSPLTPLKLHIKRESSGAHHIRHSSHSSQSSSSPLKVKIKRDPETSSMLAASEIEPSAPREKKESLKVRLSLPSATSSSQDKHSRHKTQDSAAPHQKITILMGLEGAGASSARVLPPSYSSNGHNDRRRSKHSRGGSHDHHDSQQAGFSVSTSSDPVIRKSASSSTISAGPPPAEASASAVNIHNAGGSSGSVRHISHRPSLQSQYSGFSLGDGFLSSLPADIFEPDTPTGAGDLNGLGSFEAPQTPTADNMKQVQAHMQQMMAQHKSQSEHLHHHSLHNSHLPLPLPHHLYLRDNRFSQAPPLPPPLPPEPDPPPPPPPPPSH